MCLGIEQKYIFVLDNINVLKTQLLVGLASVPSCKYY